MKLQVQGTAWWEIAAVAYAFGPRWGNPFRHFAVFVFNVFTQAFQVLLISWSRWYFDSCLELSGNVSSKRRGFILNITSSGINGFARQWMTKAQEYSWPRFERVFYLFLEAMGPSRWSRCFSFNVEGREFIIFFRQNFGSLVTCNFHPVIIWDLDTDPWFFTWVKFPESHSLLAIIGVYRYHPDTFLNIVTWKVALICQQLPGISSTYGSENLSFKSLRWWMALCRSVAWCIQYWTVLS